MIVWTQIKDLCEILTIFIVIFCIYHLSINIWGSIIYLSYQRKYDKKAFQHIIQ